MRIGVIGAGFTGLAATYYLSQKGHDVTIFEKDSEPGGLAIGYKEKNWDWSLEQHYHHWFTNDFSVLQLAEDINYPVIIKRPITSVYSGNSFYQLDSPLAVLKFPRLNLLERIRMGAVLGALRYNPYWKPLEGISASKVLPQLMGKKAYSLLWEPQLLNKFGPYISDMSLAWFWARVKKRTSSLAYPVGGFLHFAKALVQNLSQSGVTFYFHQTIHSLSTHTKGVDIILENKTKKTFDKVIVTLPTPLFFKLSPQLPDSYKKKYGNLQGLGAVNLVLRLKEQFLRDRTYWLSICNAHSPIMAVVEHTNFMDKKHYDNEHLVYLGNYVTLTDKRYTSSDAQLLQMYDAFLQKLHKDYDKGLIGYKAFRAPFAQPIIPINYSHKIPPLVTPLENVYLSNIQQVYPWDRGTNYAVELGQKVANLVTQK